MEVISTPKYLKVVAVGDKSLCNLVDLLRLLRLSSPLTENDIAFNVETGFIRNISTNTNKAGLFGMLKIVAMPFRNLAIDSLLYPGNFIDKTIIILLHHVKGHAIFGVDNPDEKEPITLYLIKRNVKDFLVI